VFRPLIWWLVLALLIGALVMLVVAVLAA